jgi:hypothetical protein
MLLRSKKKSREAMALSHRLECSVFVACCRDKWSLSCFFYFQDLDGNGSLELLVYFHSSSLPIEVRWRFEKEAGGFSFSSFSCSLQEISFGVANARQHVSYSAVPDHIIP